MRALASGFAREWAGAVVDGVEGVLGGSKFAKCPESECGKVFKRG